MNKFLGIGLIVVTVGSIATNVLMYQRYSSGKPVVLIGSDSVTIKDFRDRLELVSGKGILSSMVARSLVMSEAKAKNLAPKPADIDERVELMLRSNVPGVSAKLGNPLQKMLLTEDIETSMALENITVANVAMTDGDLMAWFKKNKKSFILPDQTRTTIVVAKNVVDASTAEKLLLQKEPRIDTSTIARTPRLGVLGLTANVDWKKIPLGFRKLLISKVGVSVPGSVFKLLIPAVKGEQGGFLIVRVEAKSPAGVPPFAQIRKYVEHQYKLQTAAAQGLTTQNMFLKLYKEKSPTVEVSKYSPWLADFEKASVSLQNSVKTANK